MEDARHYRLAMSKTSDGLLRVETSPERSARPMIAIYEDDRVFLRLVRNAGLDPQTLAAMERALVIGFSSAQTPSCCEMVRLSDEQLIFLRLGSAGQFKG
jgi:hypothetical protein